jgi:hypothetical protein
MEKLRNENEHRRQIEYKRMPCCADYWGEEILISGEKTSSIRGRRRWQFNLNCTLHGDYDDKPSKSNNGEFYNKLFISVLRCSKNNMLV